MKVFADSNVFLRLITRDDEKQQEMSVELIRRAEAGEIELIIGPPVLFEIAWTLKNSYKARKEDILDALKNIVTTPGLKVLDSDIVLKSLSLAESTSTDYADSYIAASAAAVKADCIATFNGKHFARLDCTLYSFEN